MPSPSNLTASSDYPPRDLRRAARQVADSMDPVFDQAYATSTRAFDDTPRPAATRGSVPRVSNTFNVSVAVGGTEGPVPDASALEEALVDLLRTAARRQGLEV